MEVSEGHSRERFTESGVKGGLSDVVSVEAWEGFVARDNVGGSVLKQW